MSKATPNSQNSVVEGTVCMPATDITDTRPPVSSRDTTVVGGVVGGVVRIRTARPSASTHDLDGLCVLAGAGRRAVVRHSHPAHLVGPEHLERTAFGQVRERGERVDLQQPGLAVPDAQLGVVPRTVVVADVGAGAVDEQLHQLALVHASTGRHEVPTLRAQVDDALEPEVRDKGTDVHPASTGSSASIDSHSARAADMSNEMLTRAVLATVFSTTAAGSVVIADLVAAPGSARQGGDQETSDRERLRRARTSPHDRSMTRRAAPPTAPRCGAGEQTVTPASCRQQPPATRPIADSATTGRAVSAGR